VFNIEDISIKEIMDCIVNPVKSQIILSIQEKGECTAKELLSSQNDIPQATLYRTLNRLVDSGILKIVAENKVRAVTEKVYALNESFSNVNQSIIEQNDGEAYFKLFTNFIIVLMKEFQNYAEKPSINIIKDVSGFSAAPIYATGEEMMEIGKKFKEIIAPYQTRNTSSNKQNMRILATIITPPK
jgi:DNA-binding HxlR family transcriptional regulator